MSFGAIYIIHHIRFDEFWTLKDISSTSPSSSNSTLIRIRNRSGFSSKIVVTIFNKWIQSYRSRNCSKNTSKYRRTFPNAIQDRDSTSIIICSKYVINRALYGIICTFEDIHRHLIGNTYLNRSLINSYRNSRIISSCIMDKLLNIRESFLIYGLMKTFEICHYWCSRLYIRKVRKGRCIESFITEGYPSTEHS